MTTESAQPPQALVDEAREQIAREVLLNEYREEPEFVDRLQAEPACQGWKSALATADRIIAIVADALSQSNTRLKQAAEALEPFRLYYKLNELAELDIDDVIEVPVRDIRHAAEVHAKLKGAG